MVYGQDSKVIRLSESGAVETFAMNDKCAAGTGRFLEMMARTLQMKLPEMSEEEQLALLATNGMLVKRPLVVGDDFVLVGFKEAEWERLKG